MYGCNHVLLKLVEDWKYAIDRGEHVGAILMGLSKAFDCLPHRLLLSKLHAYGVSLDACSLIRNYLQDADKWYQKWVAPTLKSSAPRVRIGSSPIRCFH